MKAQAAEFAVLGFVGGAGDGNRTRTVSLGINEVDRSDHVHLRERRPEVAWRGLDTAWCMARQWPADMAVRHACVNTCGGFHGRRPGWLYQYECRCAHVR